jgi:nucleotide-binding universal stress UspA family protein
MSQPIVVPLDGSSFAEHALPQAVSLAQRAGCPLLLVMVVTTTIAPRFAEHMTESETARHEEASRAAQSYLRDVASRITAESGLSVSTDVLMGPIAAALDGYVKEKDARLIVLTSHGRGALQRAWLGSVTDGLVRRTPAPVLVVRSGESTEAPALSSHGGFRKVVIPLDGSPAARAILEPVVDLVGTQGVTYILLRVLVAQRPLPSTYLPHVAEENRRIAEARREAEQLLAQRTAEMEGRGASVTSRIVEHLSAAQGVQEVVEEVGGDLIAMTTEGKGGIGRLLVGSVADKVIRGSAIPVLVTRRDEGA